MKEDMFVLLGDVISSKKLENRENFQNKLINGCNTINVKYKSNIYSYMNIIKGSDEIGVVLKDLYEICTYNKCNIRYNRSKFNEICACEGPNRHRA